MSWENLRDAYRTRLGNLTAKSVLVLIVDEANAEGLAIVGIDRVASLTEVNQRTALRMMQVFGEIDLVTRTKAVLKGKVRPAYQVNLAKLGLDLRDQFAAAYAQAGGKCLSDTSSSVSATLKTVSATQKSVSATVPPHPLIGVPRLVPLGPPTPIVPSGEGTKAVEAATDQVMSALGISNRRKRAPVRKAIELAAEKGELPATIALEIIAAVRRQADLHARGVLKFQYGLAKFLGDGFWRDENRWGWDNQGIREARMRAEASVGTYAPQ